MSLRLYIIGFGVISLAALAVWLVFLTGVDPFAASARQFALFYLDLFFAFTGLATLSGMALRRALRRRQSLSAFQVSLRQGVWFGLLVISLFLLQGARLLTISNGVLLLLLLVTLEFFFISRSHQPHGPDQPTPTTSTDSLH